MSRENDNVRVALEGVEAACAHAERLTGSPRWSRRAHELARRERWTDDKKRRLWRQLEAFDKCIDRSYITLEAEGGYALLCRFAAACDYSYRWAQRNFLHHCSNLFAPSPRIPYRPHETLQAWPPEPPTALRHARTLVERELQKSFGDQLSWSAPVAFLEMGFDRLVECIRQADKIMKSNMISCFARPGIRSALCCLLPPARVFDLLKELCLCSNHSGANLRDRALLLCSRTLCCTGNRWQDSPRMLDRARDHATAAGERTIEAHIDSICAAFEISLNTHPSSDRIDVILSDPHSFAASDADDAVAAAEECILFALACFTKINVCQPSRVNSKRTPLLMQYNVESLLRAARVIVHEHELLGPKHPLLAIRDAACEIVSQPKAKPERSQDNKSHSSQCKGLWTRAHNNARIKLHRDAGWMEPQKSWNSLRAAKHVEDGEFQCTNHVQSLLDDETTEEIEDDDLTEEEQTYEKEIQL